jgi:uncharacterized protein (TIGR00297 family)/Raf kinase inhibitor-like YbhB/YbcL family protein
MTFIPHPSSFILLRILFGVLIAYLAYRAQALNRSGAVTAAVLGAVVFGLGGVSWAVLLLAFFISSSALSRAFSRRKKGLDEKYSKGSRRDAGQVLANGGVAGLFVLAFVILHGLSPDSPFLIWLWLAFAASLAAANADTWATELGVLNPVPPRLISTGRQVESGTSGAISLVGSLAAFAGAALIALLAWLMAVLKWDPAAIAPANWLPFLWVLIAGAVGSLVDSLLGATLQAIYYCPTCRKETERYPIHTCGTPTRFARGLPWLDNDWVNTACTAAAALLILITGWLTLAWTGPTQPDISVQGGTMITLTLSINAFQNGGDIPQDFTCEGANRSPEITWSGVPTAARSLALIVSDPDAPMGTFIHWVLYNLPPGQTNLAAGQPKMAQLPGGGTQGVNGYPHTGYDGPCPPPGKAHRYYFRLYALDLAPDPPAGLTASQLEKKMLGHILAQGEWMGKYKR